MSADALKRVEHAQQEIIRSNYSGRAANQFVNEVKESLLFQYNWNGLLPLLPAAISLVGACHVATANPEVTFMDLSDSLPAGGFKHIRTQDSLRACLVYVAMEGEKALAITGKNMSVIGASSREVTETVSRVTQGIQRLPDTQHNLEGDFMRLGRTTDNNFKSSKETERAFDSWLLAVCELHQAFSKKTGATASEVAQSISAKVQAEIEASYVDGELAKADKAVDSFKKSLEQQQLAFKTANNDVPPTWEACAQGTLNAIAGAGSSILAQALPAMIYGSNPMSAVKTGSGSSPILKAPDATPQTDPAYVAAPLLAPLVNSLLVFLTAGRRDGPDGSKFKDHSKTLTWLLDNLKTQKSSAQLGQTALSAELSSAFDIVIRVAEEIKQEESQEQKLSSGETDPATLKGWKDAITSAKQTVTKIETAARLFPGSSANAPVIPLPTPAREKNESDDIAALAIATEQLAESQKALELTQANYSGAVEAMAEIQKRMADVQKKAQDIAMTGAALSSVRKILTDLITLLIEFKVQMGQMTSFFRALSAAVTVVADKIVRNISDDAPQYSLVPPFQLDSKIIYIATLQIKAYLDLLQTISQMYSEVDVRYVSQGRDLIAQLSQCNGNPDAIRYRQAALTKFTEQAQTGVIELMGQKHQKMTENLKDRISIVADTNDKLHKSGISAPSSGLLEAMTNGSETIKGAVKERLPTSFRYNGD